MWFVAVHMLSLTSFVQAILCNMWVVAVHMLSLTSAVQAILCNMWVVAVHMLSLTSAVQVILCNMWVVAVHMLSTSVVQAAESYAVMSLRWKLSNAPFTPVRQTIRRPLQSSASVKIALKENMKDHSHLVRHPSSVIHRQSKSVRKRF